MSPRRLVDTNSSTALSISAAGRIDSGMMLGFIPWSFLPDTILQNILLSGDIYYFNKELRNDYILIYYRELSNYKNKYKENPPPGFSLEESDEQFYRSIINLRDKLRPKKELRQQKKASKKARKITSF